ncbi:hypothetical protein TARUN_7038 [Trichoderma arundinaceum]|uniref:Zn(2)-C6 fungal-type domain-containing protein n=1 Tax=Trichoderma arundinaceum TaxID=490622 RepID=A0A395NGW9_TRIAR|nr:hypothetical protein TARUN_7038 [Trichoderma arundinaceum]
MQEAAHQALQCDGTRPSCKQCVSAKHDCPGYNDDWKFINNGAKLPHKRQKRQSSRTAKTRLAEPYAGMIEKDAEIHADTAIEARHASTTLTSQRTEPLDIPPFPKVNETSLQSLETSISVPVELCFDLGNNVVSEMGVGDLQPTHFQTAGPATEASPGLISSASNSEFEMGLAALASEFMLESEQEIVFLLRHYTDNLSPWLDIFGEKYFFQTYVPRLVGTNPVLKYSIAALSAKHLSRVGGFRATNCGLSSNLALTELYPSAGQVDWAFKAANYYHQAISNTQQQSPLYGAIELALHGSSSSSLMDVVMASNAILTVYEMIDSNHDEFNIRTHDIKSKLEGYLNDGSAPQPTFSPFNLQGSSAALASYWHYHENTYGNKGDGFGHEEHLSVTKTPWVQLFSLMTRIIDKFTATPQRSDRGAKDSERNRWHVLWDALDHWHSQLNMNFEPYSHYMLSNHLTLSQGLLEPVFDEILFPTAVSAATLSYYHFACVLLLLAKPIDQSNPLIQLKDYRERLMDIRDHCIKICGIAAARPGPAARIHSVQPLFLAGQCLEEPRERRAVIQLLQDVEADTGWPTTNHVRRLHQEWYGNAQTG